MNENNALITLAYLEAREDPLAVFRDYAEIVLQGFSEREGRLDMISDRVNALAGVTVPMRILKICLLSLEKDGRIRKLPHGAGYRSVNSENKASRFEEEKEKLYNIECKVVEGLASFANGYKVPWDKELARKHLTHYLVADGNAFPIFAGGVIEGPGKKPTRLVAPSWYVAKFISKELAEGGEGKNRLMVIARGLMLYAGIFCGSDITSGGTGKYNGVDFYLDTKLILRLLGYSLEAEVKAARELATLITSYHHANICVFPHTVDEVFNALKDAAQTLRNGKEIRDMELRLHAKSNEWGEVDCKIAIEEASRYISNKLIVAGPVEYNDQMVRKHNLDWASLEKFIHGRHQQWKEAAIMNDVDSLNRINVLRRGDYSEATGDRLPLLVTSNFALLKTVRDYVITTRKKRSQGDRDDLWNPGRLPLVTDGMLTCRLWLPLALGGQDKTKVPELTFARNAAAAEQLPPDFYTKLSVRFKKLRDAHGDSKVLESAVENIMADRLTDLLIKNSAGEEDGLTIEAVACSLNELEAIKKVNLDEEALAAEQLRKQERDKLFKHGLERCETLFGPIRKFLMRLIPWYGVILTGFLAGLRWVTDLFQATEGLFGTNATLVLFAVLSIGLNVAEEILKIKQVKIARWVKLALWNPVEKTFRDEFHFHEQAIQDEIIKEFQKRVPVLAKIDSKNNK